MTNEEILAQIKNLDAEQIENAMSCSNERGSYCALCYADDGAHDADCVGRTLLKILNSQE
jgi:hypothetical protein